MLLHLGPNVITFRSLLHLGPNVITFRPSTHASMTKLSSLQSISPPTLVHTNNIKSKIVSTVNVTSAIAKLAMQQVKEDSRCRFSL